MLSTARSQLLALSLLIPSALVALPAGAQIRPREPTGVPLTPPPLEEAQPLYEGTPTGAQPSTSEPSGSAGFALMGILVGPLGFALGGLSSTSAPNGAVPFTPATRFQPLAPAVAGPAPLPAATP
jgi:hypothetical protein